jgi:hypothetical protein
MKKLSHLFFLWLASLLFVASACSAQDVTDPVKDKQEIVSLIKTLYKIKPEIYYFATFPNGKYSEDKLSELAEKYFINDLNSKRNAKTKKIDPKGTVQLPNLYPLEEDPGNLRADYRNEPLPKVKIETPELDGQRGKVLVKLSDGSLVQFFLQKRPEGWRIYKVRTFTYAPKNIYLLIGEEENERESYRGSMHEYPDTPEAPHFDSSDKPSLKLSPW